MDGLFVLYKPFFTNINPTKIPEIRLKRLTFIISMQSDTLQKFIFICGAKSCSRNGSEEVKSALKEYIKSNGLKKEVAIIKTKCMDFCKSGPNVVAGDQLYHKVSVKEAKALLQELVS